MKLFATAAIAASLLVSATAAQAANLVANGGFEDTSYTSNTQFGAGFGGQGVANWSGLGGNHLQFYYFGGTQHSVNAVNQFGDGLGYFYDTFNALSPNGGNFVALDGDTDYSGQVTQTIGGLTIGKSYDLTFDWAAGQLRNRAGDTTEKLAVTFGGQTFETETLAVPSGQFSGWKKGHFSFIATSASQALTFLSKGTPNGQPPIAALDGVSLTGSVPEPATWAMMLLGLGGAGAMLRRRRAAVA
ncbi:PEPxxWA-CTERM sorting domain-containing protein [Phenylobacterium sp.]|uniref:PEPxxWA-CTERM sorting domain-containing protein n=1 Tax=Phenylobacterium sp. TaxID=1871053 RepID=UPI0025CE1D89|nr:PEPxxWA-CTERM sorting domain-containing protein [Phenylobacterium sp.]